MGNEQLKNPRRLNLGVEMLKMLEIIFLLSHIGLGILGLANLDTQTLNSMQVNPNFNNLGFEVTKNIMIIRNLGFLLGGILSGSLLNGLPSALLHKSNH